MSNRSAKLLLEIADSIALSRRNRPMKLAGCYEIPVDVGLIMDIEQWARGYREYIKTKGKKQ